MFNPDRVHPELLDTIPQEFRSGLLEFAHTGQGSPEILQFVDTSDSAQEVVETIMTNRTNRLALQVHEKIEKGTGLFGVGEELARSLGTNADEGVNLAAVLFARGAQLRQEQRDLDKL